MFETATDRFLSSGGLRRRRGGAGNRRGSFQVRLADSGGAAGWVEVSPNDQRAGAAPRVGLVFPDLTRARRLPQRQRSFLRRLCGRFRFVPAPVAVGAALVAFSGFPRQTRDVNRSRPGGRVGDKLSSCATNTVTKVFWPPHPGGVLGENGADGLVERGAFHRFGSVGEKKHGETSRRLRFSGDRGQRFVRCLSFC